MDTSDSECFESADEDFHSEDEVIERVKVEGEKFKKLNLESESVEKYESQNKEGNVDEKILKKPEGSGNCHLKSKNEIGSEDLKSDESVGNDEECKLASKSNDNEEISKKPEQSSNFQSGNKIEVKNEKKLHDEKEECDKEKEFLKKPVTSDMNLEKLNLKHDDKDKKYDLGIKTVEITNKSTKSTNPFKPEIIPTKQLHAENKPNDNQEIKAPNKPSEAKETNDGWDIDNDENLWDEDEAEWPDANKNEENPNENMWENDEWENIEETTQNNESEEQKSWGTWDAWSLLSTATQTITNQVSLTNVLEAGMGIPSAEELAKQHLKEEKEFQNENLTETSTDDGFIFGNLASGIMKFVETTSTKVISGGLDTLETIGKKTMEVLQEGDPGLKKKRALLKLEPDKPILSQVLREAKENAEKQLNTDDNSQIKHVIRKPNYETLFDDHHGLVHLEALEMLSKQCEIKLNTLLESCTPEAAIDMQETMDQVKELCELPEEDEDDQQNFDQIKEKISSAVEEINISISYKRLMQTWEEIEEWLNKVKLNVCDEDELHLQAIKSLAQITALAVEQFHKTGELLLIKEHRSTADEADSLVQLTTALTALIGNAAAKFSDKLNAKLTGGFSNDREHINGLITNVFYEAGNSSSYIQDAFQLLVPVLQVGAV